MPLLWYSSWAEDVIGVRRREEDQESGGIIGHEAKAEGAAVVVVVDDPAGNIVPVAVADIPPEALFPWHPVTLHGQASYDSESDTEIDFTWTQVRGPRLTLNHPDQHTVNGRAWIAGDYAFELRVSDGIDRSPPARIDFEVAPTNPGGQ